MRGKWNSLKRCQRYGTVFGDADFLEGEAYSKRPDLHWQKEEINNGKYIVKGE